MAVIKNRIGRTAAFFVGILSLSLGVIGIFLPLLPTTPFILLATWCFLKSSPKMHRWIYQHSVFGPILKNWEENRAIKRPIKILAISMILASLVFIFLKVDHVGVKSVVTILLVSVIAFIATRRS